MCISIFDLNEKLQPCRFATALLAPQKQSLNHPVSAICRTTLANFDTRGAYSCDLPCNANKAIAEFLHSHWTQATACSLEFILLTELGAASAVALAGEVIHQAASRGPTLQ